jgi:23S rRNA maturation-related 3'-5' exoribonuclease YhaM
MKHEVFKKELGTIANDDIRDFVIYLLNEAPDYFYEVSASSTGKHHPSYALGNGGLVRHTQALVGIMNHLLALEQYQAVFTTRQMDLLRISGLLHDIKKHGDDGSEFTVFEHPVIVSTWILEMWLELTRASDISITAQEIAFVSKSVASHMGQWNTNQHSSIVLP